MAQVPSLVSLCIEALKEQIINGEDVMPDVYELPSELFNGLVTQLPPVALQKLQSEMPFSKWDDYESMDDCFKSGRKRGRNGNFTKAWKALVKSRWPYPVNQDKEDDWQQMYWETHVQNCLDEAAELAVLPFSNGCIGEINISDTILRYIGCVDHKNHSTSDYSKLSYHCQHFGSYVRSLRIQSVLCVEETCQLLRSSNLQRLDVRWIRSKEHVEGLCGLLLQNNETLKSIKFIYCRLSSTFINAICGSLCKNRTQAHAIQNFSISTSITLELDSGSLPDEFVTFLSSGRSLCSLKLCYNHLDRNFARLVWSTLLDASSNISILDLSENNITGWLSSWRSPSRSQPALGMGKSLLSLRVLNLRGNNLCKEDAASLRHALLYVPQLENLDLSDNPIMDDGIRCLCPYIVEASERFSSLVILKFESCELSSSGVIHLLNTLTNLKSPLKSLSIADNGLGSQVATALGSFLGTSIQAVNIGGIGLGSSGFQELQEQLMKELEIVDINIRGNRGGIEAAKFVSKIMSCAPKLAKVNAAYNLMPVGSLDIICSAVKGTKGHLQKVDLTGNTWECSAAHTFVFAEFQHEGNPVVILPSHTTLNVPYDDEP